ncbi:GNAT family N-acetyltransferase [Vibrio proteolyticus]|uniref:ElaA protein n=1 Tax=Vibrio proteolyticus NBRC 13287 TaxID=1219065 RepID=U2ZDZ9_VIBPR|nr:GNAT family N-acetyltransferase [Vibrio proteolyticus]GAD65931.1 ElaA protein [Vibrio proteolyticus NBRC 13287]
MIHWKVKKFQDLTADELYTLLRLRCEIFIVEFNTPYNDLDGKDTHPETLHVMGYDSEKLVAYSRIMPERLGYPAEVMDQIKSEDNDVSIGRVVVDKQYRGQKLGNVLMDVSFETTRELYPEKSIFISAQAHLKDYYGRLGFDVITDRYQEDGCTMLGLRFEVNTQA